MRAVVARVSQAAVHLNDPCGPLLGAIDEPGLLVLLGVARTDTRQQAHRMATKLRDLRILDGERSCAETGAPLLVVSQFTLYGDTRKGRRPSWSTAAAPDHAEPLVHAVVESLRRAGALVRTGRFGARMAVSSVNDGPFTVLLET